MRGPACHEDAKGTEGHGGGIIDRTVSRHAEVRADLLSAAVIGAAIAVHRRLGPGLLESVYQECLRHELRTRQLPFEAEVHLPVVYDGARMECTFRVDLVVAGQLVVELKCVEALLPIHRAQIITYLRLGGFTRGLLINFNSVRLVDGLVRVVA